MHNKELMFLVNDKLFSIPGSYTVEMTIKRIKLLVYN